MTFEQRQFIEASKRVSKRWGRGLCLLAAEVQEALVKAEVLSVIAANDGHGNNPLAKLAAYTCQHVAGQEPE